MFTEIGDIRSAINKFEAAHEFTLLRKRWDTDYNLWTNKPYDAGRGYYSYTSNLAHAFARKIMNAVKMGKMLIRVPDEVLTAELREKANNVERFLYGCYTLIDERGMRMPNTPSLMAQKVWHAAIRGGFVTRPYLYKGQDGQTIVDNPIWDLYTTAYGESDGELDWVAYSRHARKRDVEKDYDRAVDTLNSEVVLVEYWDKEKYGVFSGNEWMQDLKEHKVGHCPAYIVRTGDMPLIWQQNATDMAENYGESVFSGIREIVPILNKTMSDYLTLVRRGVKSPYVVMTATGESQIDEDIWQVEKAAKIDLKLGESITPLVAQAMPPDADKLVSMVLGDIQRDTLPFTAYGELDFRLSGYAINQLHASIETVAQPITECIEQSVYLECREFLEQYASKSLPTIEVRGRTSKGQAFGYPTGDLIKASDIEGTWHPEVKMVPILPKDDAQQLQLANLARQGDIPLLSMKTLRTDYLGVADADLESKQVAMEWSDNITINKLYDAYLRAVSDGDKVRAMNILDELRRMQMAMMPQQSQATPTPTPSKSGAEAMNMAGAGLPVPKTGVSPQVMPAENMGGFPPGAMNAR